MFGIKSVTPKGYSRYKKLKISEKPVLKCPPPLLVKQKMQSFVKIILRIWCTYISVPGKVIKGALGFVILAIWNNAF